MNQIHKLLLIFLLLFNVPATAQRICGSAEHLHDMELSDANFAAARQLIEQQTQAYLSNPNKPTRLTVEIPVVVHVVYRTAVENISDAQIHSQIQILNEDFRKLNADFSSVTPSVFQAAAADCAIQFVLAKQTPSGDSSTGITRTQTTVTSFTTNNSVKFSSLGGKDAWPASQYLNIWVCKLASGLLGYAQFPGGPAASDGVVCSYRAFGNTGAVLAPFNKGRTATHEVGHWLNLFHIWGDDGGSCNGTDLVGDTPDQGAEHYGCPAFPSISCNNGPNGAMFMNFMDYTDDACMSMFTLGQKARMDVLFLPGGARASLLNSNGGSYPLPPCSMTSNIQTVFVNETDALIDWDQVSGAMSYHIRYRILGDSTWNYNTSSINSYILSGLTGGTTYEFGIQTSCTSGLSAWSPSQNFTTTSPAPICAIPVVLPAQNITENSANIIWNVSNNSTGTYLLRYRLQNGGAWLNQLVSDTTIQITALLPASMYEVQVQNTCSFGTSLFSSTVVFTTNAAPVYVCTDNYEPNNLRIMATQIQPNSVTTSMIATSGDNDYFKFTTNSAEPKVKIRLSNLPLDYDLKLYKPNGVLIATSQNANTRPEQIILNSAVFGDNYVARVYGYNGVFDNTSCYNLQVETSANNFRTEESMEDESLKPEIYFYPNPASSTITTEIYKAEPELITCHIYNALGQVVATQCIEAQTGFNEIRFSIASLANGFYVMEIIDAQEKVAEKFEILH